MISIPHASQSKTTHVQLTFLGPTTIVVDGQPMPQLPGQKVIALLAYLCCQPGPHARIHLADLLWEGLPRSGLLANLRSLLRRLPSVFKPYIHTTAQTIAFKPADDVWVDVLAFQAMAAQHEAAQYEIAQHEIAEALDPMLTMYGGLFLADLALDNAPRFSDWQYMLRERLEQVMLNGLSSMIELCLQQEHYAQGIVYAQRFIELDPLAETARRQLMVLLAQSGQQQTALETYRALVDMLDVEWGVPPSPETEDAYERIFHRQQVQTPPVSMLPILTPPLIKRQVELTVLIDQLQNPDCRLITVTGLGGTGKSYLTIDAARWLEANGPKRVVYLSLADMPSTEHFLGHMINLVGVQVSAHEDRLALLCAHCKTEHILFMLDDLEHLFIGQRKNPAHLPSSGDHEMTINAIISQLLQTTSQTQFLVTSRQPLQMQSEQLFLLAGMSLPPVKMRDLDFVEVDSPEMDSIEVDSVEMADSTQQQSEAMLLFEEAARRSMPDFGRSEENQHTIEQFCQLMQGTPLAIVLGAAQMNFLTPEELLAACQTGLDVLQTDWGDLPPRQRSMHMVFEHSWQRLDASLQLILQKLALFRGSFTTQAARKVVGVSIRQLKQLYNQSLIREIAQGRYEVHHLLRLFAIEKMGAGQIHTGQFYTGQFYTELGNGVLASQSPDWQYPVRSKHMQFYLALVGEQTEVLQRSRPFEVVAQLRQDHHNIQQAWQQAAQQGSIDDLAQSLDAWIDFYLLQGWYQEALDALADTMQQIMVGHIQKSPPYYTLCRRLYIAQGIFYLRTGAPAQAVQAVERAITIKDTASEIAVRTQAMAHWVLASSSLMQGDDDEAYRQVIVGLGLAQQINDVNLTADCLGLRGDIHHSQGEIAAAMDDVQTALRLYQQTENRHKEAGCWHRLGVMTNWATELTAAQHYFDHAERISSEINDTLNLHRLRVSLAYVGLQTGDYTKAFDYGKNALRFYQQVGDKWMQMECHVLLGNVYQQVGRYSEARLHHDQALQLSYLMNARQKQLTCLIALAVTYRLWGSHQEAHNLLKRGQQLVAGVEKPSASWQRLQGLIEQHMADILQ
ncbi:MAG: BTAD domain-containing putative transcriptional regulator [Chloroflexota bacterium]